MKTKLCYIALILLLLSGCGKTGKDEEKPSPTGTAYNYVFDYNGVDISVNAEGETIVKALGEPLKYFEAESCAFEGIDKTYTYKGFELTLYPDEKGTYRVWSVYFTDDTVNTEEGIGLGASRDDVISAYGDDYKEASGQYVYIKAGTRLVFIITDGKVTSIEYSLDYE